MSEDHPPSYRPGARPPRPDTSGARPVGAPQPAPTRRIPRRPASGAPATPPSYAPGSTPGARQPRPPARTANRPAAQPASIPPTHAAARTAGPPTGAPPSRPTAPARPARRKRRGRWVWRVLILLLVVVLAWPIGLLFWANSRLQHVEALSGGPNTPGTTYLLAGSDSRADGTVPDGTEGQRSDTIMLLHAPADGPTALVSLPRDTLVDVPGHGQNKLNAAYSLGGAPLLVETVEDLTGLTMDHYVEIGMGGVQQIVDAVGGVELCLDYDVADEFSGLNWTAGCHVADGATALAFARMRYSDPEGDIGRTNRQRQVVGAIADKAVSTSTLTSPGDQLELIRAGTGALVVDEDANILDLGRMGLAFLRATGENGLVGTPPIGDFDYRPGGLGSTVLLDENRAPQFFADLATGDVSAEDFQQVP